MTKETVAEVFGAALLEDTASREMIAAYFQTRGKIPTENNWKQALVPEGGRAVANRNGTAPGIIMEKKDGMSYCCPDRPMS